ncbi:MAG: class C sortase [Clostridia bacterium]|nr:class C sortase [Clostridia bacterium]
MEKNTEKTRKKKKSRRLTNLLLALILLVGVGLLGYPAFSDYWNSFHQSRAIIGYAEKVANLDAEKYAQILQEAMDYNEAFAQKPNQWSMDEEETALYNDALNVAGTGNMGFISIPKLDVNLPIYHGTSESVLQTSIGHIEGTSLPVGSPHLNEEDFDDIPFGSHSVLSGHRGLPSARLFSDLNMMEVGDVFYLTILDQTLTYQVTEVNVVLPGDSSLIQLVPGLDLCTLVTCTPYGINTHRLLVRGQRVQNPKQIYDVRITADAIKIEPYMVAPFIAVPVLILLVIWGFILSAGRRRF